MRIRIVAIGMLLLLSVAVTAALQSGNDLYQQGLARETAGDIQGAIQIFERIVRDFSSNRTLTARALVQLGRWSDLLGQDQARKYYERVVREFSDQKEPATEARTRLDVLTRVSAPGTSPARRLVVDWPDWNRRMGNNSVRLTRDGRHMVRYNEAQRAFEEVEISTGNVRRLTSDGPNPGEVSTARVGIEFSTDRRRLATAVKVLKPQSAPGQTPNVERVELRVFEVGGRGTGRVLAGWDARSGNEPEVYPIGWSPRDDLIWLWIIPSDQSVQIASVDMSGKLQLLKTLTWSGSSQIASLSPDGRFLAYHDAPDRQAPPDIYILATDGKREQRIEHPAADSRPVFLPDGSGIVFQSNRRGHRDLWFHPLADGRPAGPPRLVWHDVGYFGIVDRFTDTGSLVYYFAVNDLATFIAPLDFNATTGSIGEPTRLDAAVEEANTAPAFSPDGQYLAHFRANASRLVLRELRTGREREIGLGAVLQSTYARINWCPSGNELIAAGFINGSGWVAYRVAVKDATRERLPIAASSWPPPQCVGDGKEIIYIPAETRPNAPDSTIVRRTLASGREITLFKGNRGPVALSPDGSRLAIVTIDPTGDTAHLVTMPATGGEVSADLMISGTLLQGSNRYALMDFVWMPGSDRLLVVRADGAVSPTMPLPTASFWEVPLTGAAPRRLGPMPLLQRAAMGGPPAGSFTVHPDGKQLAFHFHEGLVQQTWAIDNLAQFIKAGGGW